MTQRLNDPPRSTLRQGLVQNQSVVTTLQVQHWIKHVSSSTGYNIEIFYYQHLQHEPRCMLRWLCKHILHVKQKITLFNIPIYLCHTKDIMARSSGNSNMAFKSKATEHYRISDYEKRTYCLTTNIIINQQYIYIYI